MLRGSRAEGLTLRGTKQRSGLCSAPAGAGICGLIWEVGDRTRPSLTSPARFWSSQSAGQGLGFQFQLVSPAGCSDRVTSSPPVRPLPAAHPPLASPRSPPRHLINRQVSFWEN